MGVFQGICGAEFGTCVAWKGAVGDDGLYFGVYSGTNWDNQGNTVPGKSSMGPALAATSNGLLHAAWRGAGTDQRLYHATFDVSRQAWSGATEILNVVSNIGPSLAAIGNTLYAGWVGANNDLGMYFASFDQSNNTWSSLTKIPAVTIGNDRKVNTSNIGPALASIGTTLYAAWADPTKHLFYASLDTSSAAQAWSNPMPIRDFPTDIAPSLASTGSTLYVAWRGVESDQGIYYSSLDPSNSNNKWSAKTAIPDATSKIGPAIAAQSGSLIALWAGPDNDQSLYFKSFDPSKPPGTWSPALQIPKVVSALDFVPPPPEGLGGNSNYYVYSNCNPLLNLSVIIAVTEDIVGTKGIGIQLNAYSAADHTVGWQQWFMGIGPERGINWGKQLWSSGKGGVIYDPGGGKKWWHMPSLTLPKKYKLSISFTNDPTTQNVTGATFSVIDDTGAALLPLAPVLTTPIEFQAPIIGFQLNIVGPTGNLISAGAGTITYTASNQLSFSGQSPLCPVKYPRTAENSSSFYSMVPPTPSTNFAQTFGYNPNQPPN